MEHPGGWTALVSGASGLVGEQLLQQLLNQIQYTRVIAVARKPLPVSHAKFDQLVTDFGRLPEALHGLKADHGYCCLGTTLKTAGSKKNQYIIDHDYVVSFATACHTAGVQYFAVVSSIGANAGSSNFYLRTKGEMERDLQKIPFRGLYILQPSFLLGDRKEFRAGEKIAIPVMRALKPLMIGGLKKYRGVLASAVAACMIRYFLREEKGVKIIRSDNI
jgi:uncharacterized protein YbjT (DUF2867 family)